MIPLDIGVFSKARRVVEPHPVVDFGNEREVECSVKSRLPLPVGIRNGPKLEVWSNQLGSKFETRDEQKSCGQDDGRFTVPSL